MYRAIIAAVLVYTALTVYTNELRLRQIHDHLHKIEEAMTPNDERQ